MWQPGDEGLALSRERAYPSLLFAAILKGYFAFSPTQLLFAFWIFCGGSCWRYEVMLSKKVAFVFTQSSRPFGLFLFSYPRNCRKINEPCSKPIVANKNKRIRECRGVLSQSSALLNTRTLSAMKLRWNASASASSQFALTRGPMFVFKTSYQKLESLWTFPGTTAFVGFSPPSL